MEQEVLTSQRGHNGSRNNAPIEEQTRERLSSLIRQKGLTEGRDDCYWVLLAVSSRDRFVILEGIHESCWHAACNDEFQLVAVGSAASEDGCAVLWPAAKDLACVVHKIMWKKRNAANDSEILLQESAIRGLPVYHIVGFSSSRPEEFRLYLYHPQPIRSSSVPSLELELEMQMLSRALKPPTVLAAAAASPALLAQGPLDDPASSSSAPLALVSVGMDMNPSEAADHELPGSAAYSHFDTRSLGNFLQELSAAPPQFIARSSGGGRSRNGVVVPAALIELLFVRRWWRDYDLQSQRRLQSLSANYDLEAGGRARRVGGGAAAPVQEPSEVTKMLEGVMVQAYAAFLPACVTAYPLLKDAPDYVKFTIFGGLASITVGLFTGILSRSVARRGLAIRLVSFWAIAVLTFSVASQLSSRTYIALTALVGLAVNLIVMLLPF